MKFSHGYDHLSFAGPAADVMPDGPAQVHAIKVIART
jgi:hypothetical protein